MGEFQKANRYAVEVMIQKSPDYQMVSWYAYNIGTVKTVTYDDKNNLVSSSVLVEIKGK